jgi:hypothetical protein
LELIRIGHGEHGGILYRHWLTDHLVGLGDFLAVAVLEPMPNQANRKVRDVDVM